MAVSNNQLLRLIGEYEQGSTDGPILVANLKSLIDQDQLSRMTELERKLGPTTKPCEPCIYRQVEEKRRGNESEGVDYIQPGQTDRT